MRLAEPWLNATTRERDARPKYEDDCLGHSIGGFTSGAACLSRDVKVRPHLYLGAYAASLYVDANVRVDASPSPLLRGLGARDLAYFTFDRSLRAEGDYVFKYLKRRLGLKKPHHWGHLRKAVDDQIARYGTLDVTAYGKVLLRRHTFATCYFNERWWHELYTGLPRDQLSLEYAKTTAQTHVHLKAATLNAGPGAKKCNCAADDANFQAYFTHLGSATHLGANWKGRAPA